jgi:hypothetical protein
MNFYVRAEQTGPFSEFNPDSSEFDALVLRIAQEVYALLQELRTRLLAPPPDLAVYVAAVSSNLESWRTRVVNELTAWNCRVYPEASLPPEAARAPEALAPKLSASVISKSLSSCSVSVHCIGSKRGITPEDETLPIDLLQLTCARSAQIDRIVCQIEQPHAALEELLKPKESQAYDELILPATTDVLLQFLEDRIASLRKTGTGTSGDLKTVYVVCSSSGWNDALRLKQCLEAERRFAAILPLRDVDDASVRLRDHRATLKSCQAVVVYWGTESTSWFREQQREVIGARQKRRSKPLPALCLSSSSQANPAANNLPGLPLQEISALGAC